jgi:hypothetical protein
MSVAQAIKTARAAGIELALDGDDLALSAASAPPAAVLDGLFRHKAEIVALLRERGAVEWLDQHLDPPPPHAQKPLATALAALAQLNPAKPPGDVSRRRWAQFVDDCGLFLNSDWVHRAMALGWTSLDLFGCNRERPMARIDHQGLLWLLNGNKLVALAAETAVIEMPTGSRQTYRRAAVWDRTVLAWELALPKLPKPIQAPPSAPFDSFGRALVNTSGNQTTSAGDGIESSAAGGPVSAVVAVPAVEDGANIETGGPGTRDPISAVVAVPAGGLREKPAAGGDHRGSHDDAYAPRGAEDWDEPFGPGRAYRPRTADGFQVMGAEPPGAVCLQCAKSDGAVYLIRDPRRGVRSEALHELRCGVVRGPGLGRWPMSAIQALEAARAAGVRIKPDGDKLALRAPVKPPAVLDALARHKAEIIALLRARGVVEWLDQHPAPSPPGRCAWCGRPEARGAVVLPFGTEPHTWLHTECWPAWHQERMAAALACQH